MQEDITFQPEEFSAIGDATPAFGETLETTEPLEQDGAAEDIVSFDDEDVDEPSFADDDLEMEAERDQVVEVIELDPRVAEMRDALQTLRDTEVSHALRELRQLFPHIPFPKRVRALMAVRHGAMAG